MDYHKPLVTEELMPVELLDESVDIIDWGKSNRMTTNSNASHEIFSSLNNVDRKKSFNNSVLSNTSSMSQHRSSFIRQSAKRQSTTFKKSTRVTAA